MNNKPVCIVKSVRTLPSSFTSARTDLDAYASFVMKGLVSLMEGDPNVLGHCSFNILEGLLP